MTKNIRLIDSFRGAFSDVENALVDEMLAGRVDRREFMRFGSALGLGLPLSKLVATASRLSGSERKPFTHTANTPPSLRAPRASSKYSSVKRFAAPSSQGWLGWEAITSKPASPR